MGSEIWNVDRFSCDLTARLLSALTGMGDPAALATVVAESAAGAEELCSGRPMACAAGCPHCCVLNVAVLLPEAMVIAEWMREHLPPPQLDEMQQRLRVHRCWTRWMDDEERIAKHVECPFLDQGGSCLIHPVRPLSCRGVACIDSARCREAMAPGITDEPRLVPADLLRRSAYDAAFTSLARALASAGFDDRSIELGTGVLAFLEAPERAAQVLNRGKLHRELWQ